MKRMREIVCEENEREFHVISNIFSFFIGHFFS